MQAALAPRLGSATAGPLGRRLPLTAAQRPWMAAGSRRVALRAAAEGQKDRHRFVADTESEDEVDPDSDIPMSQRLTARDTFREMAHMPPEYPPEPEAYNPDKHRTVDEMVSDADEMLPDDPVGLDEEIITDTKPFIQDLYNETAGVKRTAPPRSAASAASNVDAPGHSPGAVGNRPTEGGTAMSLGGAWPAVSNLPRGGATRMSTGEGDREERKAEAEAEVTDMKHGAGEQERSEGEAGPSGGGGAEGDRIVPEAGPAAAKGAGCSPAVPGIGDKPQPVSGAVAVRAAAKALRSQREAAAKSLQQGGLSEGGPGMADRTVAEAAAQGMEEREEAGSEKGAGATGGGGTGGSSGGGASASGGSQGHATSRATSAQDVGGASGAAGSIEKEAAAQGKEGGQEEEEELPGWGGSGTREDRRARRHAMEQMGGGDRPGLTLFLDKEQRE